MERTPAKHRLPTKNRQEGFTKQVEQSIYKHFTFTPQQPKKSIKRIKVHKEHKSWALIKPINFSINLDTFYYKGVTRFWHRMILSIHVSFIPEYN